MSPSHQPSLVLKVLAYEAECMITASTRIREQHCALPPDRHCFQLVDSLSSVSSQLLALGMWDLANRTNHETVRLCSLLYNWEPTQYRLPLCVSLHNHASSLRKLDRAGEARAADYRGSSLHNLTNQIIQVGTNPVGDGAFSRVYKATWCILPDSVDPNAQACQIYAKSYFSTDATLPS